MTDAPITVPIGVNGQMRLFDGGLTDAQVREIFADARLRADRDGLFAQPKPEADHA